MADQNDEESGKAGKKNLLLKVKGSSRGADLVGGTFAYGINDIEHQLEKEREREREREREENCYRPSTGLAEVSVT
jgi:hypothetical protein